MADRNKTWGGRGTNQYQVRGYSKKIALSPPAEREPFPDETWQLSKDTGELIPPILSRQQIKIRTLELTIAEATHAAPEELARLASSTDKQVRKAVAGNERSPGDTLALLCADRDYGVRKVARTNPHLPIPVIEQLITSSDTSARFDMAANISTPAESLDVLVTNAGDDQLICCRIARHLNTSPETLRGLADSCGVARVEVAGNPHTPPDVLIQMIQDPDITVAQTARHNPSLPPHIRSIVILGGDSPA